ncbi:MAG: EamA family transporter [Methanotrichaceae archaeon]|nr:EamA family transporter [Methanotrichaceae archaeon]
MEWLTFAFLGTIFFTVAGVLNKLLLSSYADDSNAYIVCQVLASQLFTIPVFLIVGADFVYPESLIALLFGSLQVFPAFYYMKALQVEETSKVTALEYVYPLFVFIGSVLLLGEVLELKHCVGGLLLLIGTLLISYKKNESDCRGLYSNSSDSNGSNSKPFLGGLSPAIKPFLSYWVLTAAYFLSLKYLLVSIDEWNLYIWSSLGSLIVVLPLMGIQSIRSEVKSFFSQGGMAVGALVSEEIFQFLGIIFSLFAYAIGSVTLVSSIGALQPIMTVLIILGLGILTPKLAKSLNEETDWGSLKQKGISFLVVAIGMYFVS